MASLADWCALSLLPPPGLLTAPEHAGTACTARVAVHRGDGWHREAGRAGREGLHWLSVPEHWTAGEGLLPGSDRRVLRRFCLKGGLLK